MIRVNHQLCAVGFGSTPKAKDPRIKTGVIDIMEGRRNWERPLIMLTGISR